MGKSIDLTDVFSLITYEMIKSTDEFMHYDINKILICISSNRAGSRGAIYGKLVPLKFEGGASVVNYKGRLYTMPKIFHNNIEVQYLIYYYFPRFFDLPVREKINVMFHELYHINPDFNGDMRRMGKFKKAHGHSKKAFENRYIEMADNFYNKIYGSHYYNFLSMTSKELHSNFDKITYKRVGNIKPILVDSN